MKRFYLSKLITPVILAMGLSLSTQAQTGNYTTPNTYQYTVPAGCLSVALDVAGAQGASSSVGVGGKGGRVVCTLAVSPGQILYAYVGGKGSGTTGGVNGTAGGAQGGNGNGNGAGGGGSSDVRVGGTALSNRKVVGGGGGGAGYNCGSGSVHDGGWGGYPQGDQGWQCSNQSNCTTGSPGTQSNAGNTGGNCTQISNGTQAFGAGGTFTSYVGGGGGGYMGGGAGYYGGGGGGSSYYTGVTGTVTTNNYQSNDGYVIITPLVPQISGTPSSLSFGAVAVGSSSAPALFTVLSGNFLTSANIVAKVTGANPTAYKISVDGITWINGADSIIIPHAGVTPNANTNIYVKFYPGATSSLPATLEITGAGLALPVNIPLTGTGAAPCTGTPPAGSISVTPSAASAITPITMSLAGSASSGGLTYQWQSATALAGPYTNIPGAVLRTYTQNGVTANTWFRVVTTCPNTPASATSNTVTVTAAGIAAITCTPTSGGCLNSNFTVGQASFPFKIVGDGTVLSDATNPVCPGMPYYTNNTGSGAATLTTTLSIGRTYSSVDVGFTTGNVNSCQIWMDFNNDGDFTTGEIVSGNPSTVAPFDTWNSGVAHPPITIPSTILPGIYRMRVVVTYGLGGNASQPKYPNIPACPTTGVQYAETRDYKVTITYPSCSGIPYAGITDATATSGCKAFSPVLFNVGQQLGAGISYTWQQSPDGFAYSNISGATTGVYTPTVTATGTMFYRVAATCNGTLVSYSNGLPVSKYDPPSDPVSGVYSFCTNSSSSPVAATPSGGVWSTTNPSVATADAGLGTMYGITPDTFSLIYTIPTTGCYSRKTFTVNQLPSQIYSTNPSMCQGTFMNLSDTISGGTWTSDNTTIATIDPVTGVMNATGFTPVTINYTLPTGCKVSKVITVNPIPSLFAVTGGGGYCYGNPSTSSVGLSSSTAGVKYDLILHGVAFPAVTGTGGPLDWGIQSDTGKYTVFARNEVTGCNRGMVGSAEIKIYTPPALQSVGGGGSFCAGDPAGKSIYLANSEVGVEYQQVIGGVTDVPGTVSGVGGILYFPAQTTPGIYTVRATNATTSCVSTMSGSAIITIDPLPTPYPVGGGGVYCAGGTGVAVTLGGSIVGVSYTLVRTDFTGSYDMLTLAGTGGSLNFGNQTLEGTYSVRAVNNSTGCVGNMTGFVNVSISLPPAVFNVSGTGSYCSGGMGRTVSLDGSEYGVEYQLYLGTATVGAPIAGTGLNIDFPGQTTAGTYYIKARNIATNCTSTANGSAVITISSLPTAYVMGGGGPYCANEAGKNVTLSSSTTGINYQLYLNSLPQGGLVPGTGSALNFGLQTGAGVYTVIATNPLTTCQNTMTGISTIGINPLPAQFDVTGTGSYCSGGVGRPVGLEFSATGINYQLYRDNVAVGSAMAGSGSALNFGSQTVAGTYTVKATNPATTCNSMMSGNAVISINALPAIHVVTGGGPFCAGGGGVPVGLDASNTGINYQLMLGLAPMGSMTPGTGSPLNFGLQPVAGNYTVIATDPATGCNKYMSGSAPVVVNPLPTQYVVTGGGTYCTGGTGVNVGLSGSTLGIKYQLTINGVASGTPLSGTGGSLNFGTQLTPGTYTVVAKNNTTLCTNEMTGSVVVATQPLPTSYNVTGGGSYCAGGTGVEVILDGSEIGMDYQLYKGTTAIGSALTGDGFALNFGSMTGAGNYTVVATESTSGCKKTMTSSAAISINPLPSAFTVLGGGGYCDGAAGVRVFLSASTNGIQYQLYNGSTLISTTTGTGSSIDFGPQATVGAYTVAANNVSTGCSSNMAGSATVSINPLPDAHNVIGGGAYCTGGSGVHVGLDGSDAGIKYQLMNGSSLVGTAMSGTGAAVDFGTVMGGGSYTVVATNTSTSCMSNQAGSATVVINPLPNRYAVTGGGSYCETGLGVHVGISNSDLGVDYQLYHNGSPVGISLPGTGTILDLGLETATGMYTVSATNNTTGCQSGMTGSTTVSTLPILIPGVNLTSSITGTVCEGQSVSFSASPINGGAAPTYQWKVNGVSAGVGSSYSYIPLNGDVVTAMVTSTAQCAHPDTGSTSVSMMVSSMQMPSANVTADPGATICSGAPVTLTATTMYGGTAPAMTWLKNGLEVGTGSSYSYYPSNGDIITFKLNSNFNCRLADMVFGNPVTFTVENPVLPVVTVTSSVNHNAIAPGQSVTFSASATQAGSHPTYQWVINNMPVAGANASTFTTTALNNRDSVTCEVTGVCAMVGFNSVKVTVRSTGISNVSATGDVRLVPNPNRGEFNVKGTLPSFADEATLEVTNMIGQVVYSSKVTVQNGTIDEQVKLNSSLANGMYMLNLRAGSENTVFHFVIEK